MIKVAIFHFSLFFCHKNKAVDTKTDDNKKLGKKCYRLLVSGEIGGKSQIKRNSRFFHFFNNFVFSLFRCPQGGNLRKLLKNAHEYLYLSPLDNFYRKKTTSGGNREKKTLKNSFSWFFYTYKLSDFFSSLDGFYFSSVKN